jgi:hypothetical protein
MTERLKPSIRVEGGNPAGMPDFRPLNPWGQRMPKAPRPIESTPVSERLYQVYVKDERKRLIPVFPKGPKELCEFFVYTINKANLEGKGNGWTDPEIQQVKPGNTRGIYQAA